MSGIYDKLGINVAARKREKNSSMYKNLLHTQSSINTAMRCLKRWDLEYQQGWRSTKEVIPLLQGDVIHAGLNSYWRHQLLVERGEISVLDGIRAALPVAHKEMDKAAEKYAHFQTEKGIVDLLKLKAMIEGYFHQWPVLKGGEDRMSPDMFLLYPDMWVVPIAVELRWEQEIGSIRFAGKFDVVAVPVQNWPDCRKKIYVIDHKSTSFKAACEPGSDWRNHHDLETQAILYKEAARQIWEADEVAFVHDFLVKPAAATRPTLKKGTKKRKTETEEEWFLRKAESTETHGQFYDRILRNYRDNPVQLFSRREVLTHEKRHKEYLTTVLSYAHDRNHCSDVTLMNTQSCMAYSRPCPFMNYCLGIETLEAGQFKQIKHVHPELEDNDGRKVPTDDGGIGGASSTDYSLLGPGSREDNVRGECAE